MPESLLTASLIAHPRSTYFEKYHGQSRVPDNTPVPKTVNLPAEQVSATLIEKRAARAAKRQQSTASALTAVPLPDPRPRDREVNDGPRGKRRFASARHSRAPSTAGEISPAMSSSVERPFESILLGNRNLGIVTADAMDAMVDTLPRSPGLRRGRSHDRPTKQSNLLENGKQRHADEALDWHGRQLRARLQNLTLIEPSSPTAGSSDRVDKWRRTISSAETSDNSNNESVVSTAPMSTQNSLGPSRSGSSGDVSNAWPSYISLDRLNVAKHGTSPRQGIPSIDDIVSRHASPPSARRDKTPKPATGNIPSIDELVSAHQARITPAKPRPTQKLYNSSVSTFTLTPADPEEDLPRSSIDSIAAEIVLTLNTKQHSDEEEDVPTDLLPSRSQSRTSISAEEMQMAQYLRSPRLTRLLTLYSTSADRMTVSLADVGDPCGHPVFVYLGLGCARYLVALFDEIAEALRLRIICLDRWGNGQTSNVASHRRTFAGWAETVEDVANELNISKFSILAHSAGAPYAFATAFRCPQRVKGSLHLLAPWVNSTDGQSSNYKWLKLVPSKVIASAQAAEWKLQSWKLGRPPTISVTSVGFDPRAPTSSLDYLDSDAETLEERQKGSTVNDDRSSHAESENTTHPIQATPTRRSSGKGIASLFGRRMSESAGPAEKPPVFRSASASSVLDANDRSFLGISSNSPRLRHVSSGSTVSESPSFANAILRASHAESLNGGKHDLLMILERTGKPWTFDYSDLKVPCKIWIGASDEKISLSSVKTLASLIPQCRLTVLPNADHNLLTNVDCIIDVLASISNHWPYYSSAANRLFDEKRPSLPPNIDVSALTVDNAPPIAFRIFPAANAWLSADKSAYLAPAVYAREAHATRSKDGPADKQDLFLDICKHLWNFDTTKDGRLLAGASFSRLRSPFLSTSSGLPWLLGYSGNFRPEERVHLICIDLHKAIRMGVKVYNAVRTVAQNLSASEAIIRWSSGPVKHPFWERGVKSRVDRLRHLPKDAMQELLIYDKLPRSCVIAECDWQTLRGALQKSNYWLKSLDRRVAKPVVNLADALAMRRQLWKKAVEAKKKAVDAEGASVGEIYAKLGEELQTLMADHTSQPVDTLSKIRHDDARAAEVAAIFKEYIGIELGHYTLVSQHLTIWINSTPLELKSRLDTAQAIDTHTFHASAALPTSERQCASVRIEVKDVDRQEQVTCGVKCQDRQGSIIPDLVYSGSTNKTLTSKDFTAFPMRNMSRMEIVVAYKFSKVGNRRMQHTFVIEFDSLVLPGGMQLRHA